MSWLVWVAVVGEDPSESVRDLRDTTGLTVFFSLVGTALALAMRELRSPVLRYDLEPLLLILLRGSAGELLTAPEELLFLVEGSFFLLGDGVPFPFFEVTCFVVGLGTSSCWPSGLLA